MGRRQDCFYTFLVVGSVRQIKLTYVGFRAHVKIASRIVKKLMQYNNKRYMIPSVPTGTR